MSANTITPDAILQSEVVPHLLYDLEAKVADLECTLLDALTPKQFALVLQLREAVETLTATEMIAAKARRTTSSGAPRPIRRDREEAALSWLRARRAGRVA